jgi:hypothetical protein
VISLLWVREVPLREGLEEPPVSGEASPQQAASVNALRSE